MTTRLATSPDATPGRAAVIAAVHAFADFLAEHPEMPAPTMISALRFIHPHDEADESTRVSAVTRWAKANDAKIGETSAAVTASLTIADWHLHGVRIDYVYGAFFDQKPEGASW